MRTLRLHGIRIDAVRDIFGADDDLASRLRETAAQHFSPPRRGQAGLLGKLGPLFTRTPRTEVDARGPLTGDVDALLAGGFIPPERLVPSWRVFSVWLDALSRTSTTLTFDDFDDIEFDLARNGLSSDFSLRQLAEREVSVPLRPLPGQVLGYSRHLHAVETRTALLQMRANPPDHTSLEPETDALVGTLLEFLGQVAEAGGDTDVVAFTTDEITRA